jgi:hypothetical protein
MFLIHDVKYLIVFDFAPNPISVNKEDWRVVRFLFSFHPVDFTETNRVCCKPFACYKKSGELFDEYFVLGQNSVR